MKSYSENKALRIHSYFARTFLYGSGLASTIEDLESTHEQFSLSSEQLRKKLNEKIKKSIQANPFLVALHLVYDHNSLDGNDSLFLNRSDIASTEVGRFASYWSNRNGQLTTLTVTEEMLADSSPMTSRCIPAEQSLPRHRGCPRWTLAALVRSAPVY